MTQEIVRELVGGVWVTRPKDQTGGGGSTPGASRVIGPFVFTADQIADLSVGIPFYTPTVGDILIDVWADLVVTFNGTTPTADIGFLKDGTFQGLFALENETMDFTAYDDSVAYGYFPEGVNYAWGVNGPYLLSLVGYSTLGRVTPGRFGSATPLALVVSTTGTSADGGGGSNAESTVGEANVYLVVATPEAP